MNLQTAFLFSFLLLISVITAGCEPKSQRDSIRKSDLVGSKWKLSQLRPDNEEISFNSSAEISLEFRDDLIGGLSGCNNYQVGWNLGRDGRFGLGGPIAQTRNGCLEETMLIERIFIAVLTEAHTIVLAGDTLIIDSTTGQLIFIEAK